MDTLQLIDKVHSFYSEAFGQLITITIAILAFAGLLLPILLQFIQSRSFKIEKQSLHSQMSTELKEELQKLFREEKEAFHIRIDEEVDKVTKRMILELEATKAGIFFLQGRSNIERKDYAQAAEDYALAGQLFFHGKVERNAIRATNILMKKCLTQLNKKAFEKNEEIDKEIGKLTSEIEKANDNDRYGDIISELKLALGNAKSREPIAELPA